MTRTTISASHHPPSLADVLAAIAELRELIEQRMPAPRPAPEPRTWLTTAQAGALAGVGCLQTIRNWCRRYEIGELHGREWRVSPGLLAALLAERGQG